MKALLIDGLNLVRRVFSAVPVPADGNLHAHAVAQSVVASLNRALLYHDPTHAVGVFDSDGPGWRHRLYPLYKSQRTPMPGELRTALPAIISALESVGLKCVMRDDYEADDLLATIALKVAAGGGNVVILSTDTSVCQLLDARVVVYDHFANRGLDAEFVKQRFDVAPALLGDLLALVGVQSSTIPGIKGIGPKTASRLIAEHGNLEGVLTAAGSMTGRIGKLLADGKEAARLSRQLITFATDVELGVNLNQFRLLAPGARDATIPRHPI